MNKDRVENITITVLADHVKHLALLTPDGQAVEILLHCAHALNERAAQIAWEAMKEKKENR